MSALGKSPSLKRVGVIAGAFAVLASAVTPASATPPPRAKVSVVKKRPPEWARQSGAPDARGGSRRLSLEWAIGAELRP